MYVTTNYMTIMSDKMLQSRFNTCREYKKNRRKFTFRFLDFIVLPKKALKI